MVRTKKEKFGICDDENCNNKLLVPSWKYCADCDFKRYRNTYFRNLRNSIKFKKQIQKVLDKDVPKRLKGCDQYVIDEYGKIIGGKRSIYK